MAHRCNLTIRTRTDLQTTAAMVSWLRRPSVDRVVVDLPWVDEDTRQRAAKTLRRHFNDCGCFWGAPAFLLTLAILLIRDGADTWTGVVAGILLALAAGAAGKLLGLAWSRLRLLACLRLLAVAAPAEATAATRFRQGFDVPGRRAS